MKLTTPATASEPYTADAPAVTTSTRSTMRAGTMSTLADDENGLPKGRRLPSISTSVRCEPKPRRLRVDVPLAPFATSAVCATNTFGRMLTTSSTRATPRLLISSAPICTSGTDEVTFDLVKRVPVTTTSSRSADSSWADTSVGRVEATAAATAELR